MFWGDGEDGKESPSVFLRVVQEGLCEGAWAHACPGFNSGLVSFPLQALTFLLLHIGFFFLYCREGQRVRTVLWQLYRLVKFNIIRPLTV